MTQDSAIPQAGQQVITVCAFIYKEVDSVIKLFRPKRAMTKKFLPGVFELPGGHVDFGEDLEVALRREVKEELNVVIEVEEIFFAFMYMNDLKGTHSAELLYFAKFIDEENLKLNSEDHSEYIWQSEEEFLEDPKMDTKDEEYEVIKVGFEKLHERK